MERTEGLTPGKREKIMEEIRRELMEMLRNALPPEFLNRIDDIVVFNPLLLEDMREIVKLRFSELTERLEDRGIDLQLSDKALDWLAREGFDPQFGARPVKRVINSEVSRKLSSEILAGNIKEGEKAVVDLEGNEIVIIKKK